MSSHVRWVLGFDASCGRCREIAKAATKAAGGRLEVLPLAEVNVHRWRVESLGADAPWVPTLLRVDGNQVNAWTGPAMGLRLLRRLGPVPAIKLFFALGELSRESKAAESSDHPLVGRRRFFTFGAGVAIAVGIVLTGKAPALADEAGKARAWVLANKSHLPTRYAEFSRHTQTYRKAIYAELPPPVRSHLWSEHIAHYRAQHPNATPKQLQILDDLQAHVSNEATFARGTDTRADDERRGREVVDAFGREEAAALVATLGPVEPADPKRELSVTCECSTSSDYCWHECSQLPSCEVEFEGCGWLHNYTCNGMCCGCRP